MFNLLNWIMTCVFREATNRAKKRFLYDVSMGGAVVLQLQRRDPLY
jgi:hypothetical protein